MCRLSPARRQSSHSTAVLEQPQQPRAAQQPRTARSSHSSREQPEQLAAFQVKYKPELIMLCDRSRYRAARRSSSRSQNKTAGPRSTPQSSGASTAAEPAASTGTSARSHREPPQRPTDSRKRNEHSGSLIILPWNLCKRYVR